VGNAQLCHRAALHCWALCLGVTGWEALGVEIAQAIIWLASRCQFRWPTLPSTGKRFVLLSRCPSGQCRGKIACQKRG
jgi:hypothetical protein